MARKHKGEPEAIDSSPAGIAHALCVKGNADAEIAIAQTRVIRGSVSIDFLKSLLPPPTPAPHRTTVEIPDSLAKQLQELVAAGAFPDENCAIIEAIRRLLQQRP